MPPPAAHELEFSVDNTPTDSVFVDNTQGFGGLPEHGHRRHTENARYLFNLFFKIKKYLIF